MPLKAAAQVVLYGVLSSSVYLAPASVLAQKPGIPEVVEGVLAAPPAPSKKSKKTAPAPPALAPDIAIPVEPLGFGAPAPFYLGSRIAQVSLNFLDEDTLLFTFRVPGLISREHSASNSQAGDPPTIDEQHDERHIRAVVLSLPSGKVMAEALWRIHDLAPYLAALKDRRFLLRDRDSVQIGDAALHLTPFLHFPGRVTSVAVEPQERLLVANSTETPSSPESAQASPQPSLYAGPPASAPPSSDNSAPSPTAQTLLRIIRFDTRNVLLFTRTQGNVRLPLDGEGYYEAVRGSGFRWMITYADFHGTTLPLVAVESTCSPSLEVISPGLILSSACNPAGGRRLTLVTRDKRRLWEATTPPTAVWPTLAVAPGGARFARATLDVTHPVGPNYPLDNGDIRAQTVQVYDVATGKVALTVPASPILDGGGNFALSPSGARFAVLHAGSLQIFNLPPAPAVPASPSSNK